MPLPLLSSDEIKKTRIGNENALNSSTRTPTASSAMDNKMDLNLISYAIDYEGEEVNDMMDIRGAFERIDDLANLCSTSKEGHPIYSVRRYAGHNLFLDRSFTELWHDYETNEARLEKKERKEDSINSGSIISNNGISKDNKDDSKNNESRNKGYLLKGKRETIPLQKPYAEYGHVIDSINTNLKIHCKHPDETNKFYRLKAYFNRGLAHERRNEIDEAIADYTICIQIDETCSPIYYNRALMYYLKEEYDSAVQDLTSAINFSKDEANTDYNYHLMRSYINRRRNNCKEALEDLLFISKKKKAAKLREASMNMEMTIGSSTIKEENQKMKTSTKLPAIENSAKLCPHEIKGEMKKQNSLHQAFLKSLYKLPHKRSSTDLIHLKNWLKNCPCLTFIHQYMEAISSLEQRNHEDDEKQSPKKEKSKVHTNSDSEDDNKSDIWMKLAKAMTVKSLQKDEWLFRKGELGYDYYIVLSGSLAIVKENDSSRKTSYDDDLNAFDFDDISQDNDLDSVDGDEIIVDGEVIKRKKEKKKDTRQFVVPPKSKGKGDESKKYKQLAYLSNPNIANQLHTVNGHLLYKRCTEGQGFGELCAYESNGQNLIRPLKMEKRKENDKERDEEGPIENITSPLSTAQSILTANSDPNLSNNGKGATTTESRGEQRLDDDKMDMKQGEDSLDNPESNPNLKNRRLASVLVEQNHSQVVLLPLYLLYPIFVERESTLAFLNSCPLFTSVSSEVKQELVKRARVKYYEANTPLIKAGKHCEEMYIIIQGLVNVYKNVDPQLSNKVLTLEAEKGKPKVSLLTEEAKKQEKQRIKTFAMTLTGGVSDEIPRIWIFKDSYLDREKIIPDKKVGRNFDLSMDSINMKPTQKRLLVKVLGSRQILGELAVLGNRNNPQLINRRRRKRGRITVKRNDEGNESDEEKNPFHNPASISPTTAITALPCKVLTFTVKDLIEDLNLHFQPGILNALTTSFEETNLSQPKLNYLLDGKEEWLRHKPTVLRSIKVKPKFVKRESNNRAWC